MRILKTVCCVILALVVFAGVLAGTSALAASGFLRDPDALADRIADDGYCAQMCEDVRDDVDRAMLLLSVDENLFEENVSDAEISAAARAMLTAVIRRIVIGDDAPLPEFRSEKLYDAIRADVENYAAENELEVEEGAVDEVYSYLCGRVTARIRVADESYINKVPDLGRLKALLALWYIPFCAAIIVAGAIFAIRRREWKRALNAVTIPAYAAAFLGFVLSSIVRSRDYFTRVALEQSMLKELLVRIYRAAADSFVKCFGIALVAALVLLIADVVLNAVRRSPKENPRSVEEAPVKEVSAMKEETPAGEDNSEPEEESGPAEEKPEEEKTESEEDKPEAEE